MPDLIWTTDPPRWAGRFLYRRETTPDLAYAVRIDVWIEGEPWVIRSDGVAAPVPILDDVQWAGPIPEPKEVHDA